MTVLETVVLPTSDLLLLLIPQLDHGCAVGAKSVGDDGLGRTMPLQRLLHEDNRRLLIAGFGDVALEDFTS